MITKVNVGTFYEKELQKTNQKEFRVEKVIKRKSNTEKKNNKEKKHHNLAVPVDLKKLRDVVDKKIVKKDLYNAKVKEIEDKIPDITNFATTAALNAKINEVKYEIPSITNLATNASLGAIINEVKGEIPSITDFAAFTTVENKITWR